MLRLLLLLCAGTTCYWAHNCIKLGTKLAVIDCDPPNGVNLENDYAALRMVCNNSRTQFAQMDLGSINIKPQTKSSWLMTDMVCEMHTRSIDSSLYCRWECIGIDFDYNQHSLCKVSTLPSCKATGDPAAATTTMPLPPTGPAYTSTVRVVNITAVEENATSFDGTTGRPSTGTAMQYQDTLSEEVTTELKTSGTATSKGTSVATAGEKQSTGLPSHETESSNDPGAPALMVPLIAALVFIVFLILAVIIHRGYCRKGSVDMVTNVDEEQPANRSRGHSSDAGLPLSCEESTGTPQSSVRQACWMSGGGEHDIIEINQQASAGTFEASHLTPPAQTSEEKRTENGDHSAEPNQCLPATSSVGASIHPGHISQQPSQCPYELYIQAHDPASSGEHPNMPIATLAREHVTVCPPQAEGVHDAASTVMFPNGREVHVSVDKS